MGKLRRSSRFTICSVCSIPYLALGISTVIYLLVSIAALRLPREHRLYPSWVLGIGALTFIGLIVFLSPGSWVIGCLGLLTGGAWYYFRSH